MAFGGEEKVRINGSLALSCQAKGFPEPSVQWFKDGQVGVSLYQALHLFKQNRLILLSASAGSQLELQNVPKDLHHLTQTTSTLHIVSSPLSKVLIYSTDVEEESSHFL